MSGAVNSVKTSSKKNVKKSIKLNKKFLILLGFVVFVLILILLFSSLFKNKQDDDVTPFVRGTTINVTSDEFKKLTENKDNIEDVLTEEYKDGKFITAHADIDKVFNYIKSIKIVKETEERVDNYYIYYIFKMKDGNVYNIYLEGKYLRFKDKNYVIEAIDMNAEDPAKDVVTPDNETNTDENK